MIIKMTDNLYKETKKTVVGDWISSIALASYLSFVSYLVFSFLTAGGALENPDNIQKFWTYVILGIVSTLVMFIAKLENFISVFFNVKKYVSKSVSNILEAFDVFIHEPRYSVFNEIFKKTPWWLNAFDLTIIFLIIGGIIGLGSIIFETSISRIYSYLFEQQISTTAEFGLAIEPAVFGETMSLMILMGILWGLSKFAVLKGLYNKWTHYFLTIGVVPIFGGFVWMGIHYLVYGSYDVGLFVTYMWGYLQCILSMLFISVIPAYILHATTNAFTKAKELFANEITAIVVFFIIILLASIFAIRVSIFAGKKSAE